MQGARQFKLFGTLFTLDRRLGLKRPFFHYVRYDMEDFEHKELAGSYHYLFFGRYLLSWEWSHA